MTPATVVNIGSDAVRINGDKLARIEHGELSGVAALLEAFKHVDARAPLSLHVGQDQRYGVFWDVASTAALAGRFNYRMVVRGRTAIEVAIPSCPRQPRSGDHRVTLSLDIKLNRLAVRIGGETQTAEELQRFDA